MQRIETTVGITKEPVAAKTIKNSLIIEKTRYTIIRLIEFFTKSP